MTCRHSELFSDQENVRVAEQERQGLFSIHGPIFHMG